MNAKKKLAKTFFESEKYPFKSRGTSGRKGKRRVDAMQRIRGGNAGTNDLALPSMGLANVQGPRNEIEKKQAICRSAS